MTVNYRGPNINARRLGVYLRRLREILELSYDDAAAQLGCDSTWLVRVETGFEPIAPDEVRRLLDGYHVPPHQLRTVLIDLASRPDGPPWLATHSPRLKSLVRDLITLESESPVVHTFGIPLVPELVRTEAYARMCFDQHIPELDSDEEWDLLRHRQRHRPDGRTRTLDVIVEEYGLTLVTPRPEIMRGQLEHLIALSERRNATVRVIPRNVGAHAGLGGSFDILEFPAINDRLSLTHSALGLGVAACDLTHQWELLEQVTLSPDMSREVIERLLTKRPNQRAD